MAYQSNKTGNIKKDVKYLNKEQLDKEVHTPAVIITKDNVDQYYDHDALF